MKVEFQIGTFHETLAEGKEGAFHLGPEQPRVYSDLSPEEKERYNADIQATNILLQWLPKNIYTLINHYTDAKDIWDNVKMLLEGSELTKDDRESQLYDDFEHFHQNKGETIHDYYVWLAKLINDIRNIKMTMFIMQLNSKVDRIEVKGTMHKVQVQLVTGDLRTELGMQIQVKQGRLSVTNAMNGVGLDEEQLLFIAGGQDDFFDEDVDDPPGQDLALNVDNVFQADDCDAFDSDVDEAPTTQTIFIENLSSALPVYDEAGLSYDSNILSEPTTAGQPPAAASHHPPLPKKFFGESSGQDQKQSPSPDLLDPSPQSSSRAAPTIYNSTTVAATLHATATTSTPLHPAATTITTILNPKRPPPQSHHHHHTSNTTAAFTTTISPTLASVTLPPEPQQALRVGLVLLTPKRVFVWGGQQPKGGVYFSYHNIEKRVRLVWGSHRKGALGLWQPHQGLRVRLDRGLELRVHLAVQNHSKSELDAWLTWHALESKICKTYSWISTYNQISLCCFKAFYCGAILGQIQLKDQVQSRGNTILDLQEKVSRLTKKHSNADPIHDLRALDSQNKELHAKVNALLDLNERWRAENEKVKRHYKELNDSIKITRAKTIDKNNSLLTEVANLKA
nr:integrase, catalytic region, zinc finger, CCHC-type, peptidase aspartic, catalytic [Tanacetum cinerariifolium]